MRCSISEALVESVMVWIWSVPSMCGRLGPQLEALLESVWIRRAWISSMACPCPLEDSQEVREPWEVGLVGGHGLQALWKMYLVPASSSICLCFPMGISEANSFPAPHAIHHGILPPSCPATQSQATMNWNFWNHEAFCHSNRKLTHTASIALSPNVYRRELSDVTWLWN
jgi:hypothetical protein